MPIYDYHCDHCGHSFAASGRFDDPPLAVCPQCGKEPRRVISPTAIVFKGSGWYKTDSRGSQKDDGSSTAAAATGATAAATATPAATATAAKEAPATTTSETKAAAPAKQAVPKSEPKSSS